MPHPQFGDSEKGVFGHRLSVQNPLKAFNRLMTFLGSHSGDIHLLPLNRRQLHRPEPMQQGPIRFSTFEPRQELFVSFQEPGVNEGDHGGTCLVQFLQRNRCERHPTELFFKRGNKQFEGLRLARRQSLGLCSPNRRGTLPATPSFHNNSCLARQTNRVDADDQTPPRRVQVPYRQEPS